MNSLPLKNEASWALRPTPFLDTVERLENVGYWQIDLNTEVAFLSQEACAIYGATSGYRPQTVSECAAWFHGDDRDLLIDAVNAARGGEATFTFDARLIGSAGEGPRWVRVSAEMKRNAVGWPGSLIGTIKDITDERETIGRLADVLHKAHGAKCVKDAFLANMNHELRTPLNAIIGFSQLLEMMGEKDDAEPQIGEYATYISQAGQRLLGILEDIFRLSRFEAEAEQLELRALDIATLLDDLRSEARAQVRARGGARAITFDLSPCAAGVIQGDQNKILQVAVNLVSNAIKFSPSTAPIVVRAHRDGRQRRLLIEVTDKGPGIPAHLHEKIFERFERLDAATQAIEGIGVGLAIARDLVRAMGGEIGVNSKAGEGSTFWLAFPIEREERRAIAV